jgi:rhodanese-related sulfurtransferase
MKIVTRDELQRLLAQQAVTVVEALPERYYQAEHLPGARHLPHDQVIELAPQVLPDQSQAIVVYCANSACQNSHIAARELSRLGYRDVAVYAGGKQDWAEAGLPLEGSVG